MILGALKCGFLAGIVLAMTSVEVHACEIDSRFLTQLANRFDRTIKVRPDGGFRNAGPDDNFNGVGGGAFVDIGNGRVGQKIVSYFGCSVHESLLFANCNTGKSILIRGVPYLTSEMSDLERSVSGMSGTSIAFIQPPSGPIGLTSVSTVNSIANTAELNDLFYVSDVPAVLRDWKPRNRYNPLQGCISFYPNSKGARL